MLLTRELLLPALAADLKNERQINELITKIKEKDHVITRLLDKIEQSSMDLSLVFPGYGTGRKGLNVKQAVKLVPGVSRFDEDGWREKHEDPMLTTTRSASDLLRKSCFGPRSLSIVQTIATIEIPPGGTLVTRGASPLTGSIPAGTTQLLLKTISLSMGVGKRRKGQKKNID